MQHKLLCLTAFIGLIACSPFAKADEWDKRTVITFKEPVEIPGMVLPAGTYVMKLLDSPSDRDIVQIFNKTETHIFNTVLAIPAYRAEPADHTVITFEERLAGAPQAIKDWYYPGDLRGEEFVYGKAHRVTEVASNTAPPPAPAAPQAAPAPVQAAAPAPAPAPVQMAQSTPPPTPAPQAAPAPAPKTLPKTASDVPLIGLLGLFSIAGGLGLRKNRARA